MIPQADPYYLSQALRSPQVQQFLAQMPGPAEELIRPPGGPGRSQQKKKPGDPNNVKVNVQPTQMAPAVGTQMGAKTV